MHGFLSRGSFKLERPVIPTRMNSKKYGSSSNLNNSLPASCLKHGLSPSHFGIGFASHTSNVVCVCDHRCSVVLVATRAYRRICIFDSVEVCVDALEGYIVVGTVLA